MNYNLRPKQEFLADVEACKSHRILAENEVLRRSIQIALLDYQREQSEMNAPDLGGCASCYLRLQGAQQFVARLLNLAESSIPSAKTDNLNLPSNVRPLDASRK